MTETKIYDLIVIGGGPAGMMAAGRAAELGASVLLLEKNPGLGKKLLITGGGRCNVTNAEFDVRRFLAKFKDNKKFLFSPFSRFGVVETLDFFRSRGMETKIEAENRAFPTTDSAKTVWEALLDYMKEFGVTIRTNAAVAGFVQEGEKIRGVKLKNGEVLTAKNYVLATGGKSRPETGSTGEGFQWLKQLGHTVIDTEAALVPVKVKEKWVAKLAGVSLGDAKLTTFLDTKKQSAVAGKLLFTHFGLSGPLVLNQSREIGELMRYGTVSLAIDLLPALDQAAADKALQELLRERQNKRVRNGLSGFVSSAIIPVLIELSGVDPEKPVNVLTRTERLSLIKHAKALTFTPTGLMGLDKAVVTSGGVKLEEVDFKTMRSKLYPNLYLVGDVLNIDRPSGGYSLQLCWTTGFVAGSSSLLK